MAIEATLQAIRQATGPRKLVNVNLLPSGAQTFLDIEEGRAKGTGTSTTIWVSAEEKELARSHNRAWNCILQMDVYNSLTLSRANPDGLPWKIYLLAYNLTAITDELLPQLIREMAKADQFDVPR